MEIKTFRVLVVIGDQWKDPMSYLVTKDKNVPFSDEILRPEYEKKILSTRYEKGATYTGYEEQPEVPEPADFFNLMILLKSWAIPYDVVRLDQQFLDRNMFLGPDDKPLYGTIIWDVNKSDHLLHPDYSIVEEMVNHYGIGFVALSDRIWQPEIQSMLGLKYKGSWMSSGKLEVAKDHYLTHELNNPLNHEDGKDALFAHKQRMQVDLNDDVAVLVKQGEYPQVTVRELSSGARVVWIGSDYNVMFAYQEIRTLLRKAITWTIGYALYKTWEDTAIMIIDDPGTAQNVYIESWHYPSLTEEDIEKHLIKPLKEHQAVLNINAVAGFVNEEKRCVEPSWQQEFTDAFGTRHDYRSTKRGIDKGLDQGVFEILCHGLTHMQPDLTGWWGEDRDGEKAEVGWYREFGDTRRGKEIPAAEQMWRMKTARSWLESQFGVTPLQFCPGGFGFSISYEHSTWRAAARTGFGFLGWEPDIKGWNGYLSQDMVIAGWDYFGTQDSPQLVGAPPDAHDFGIVREPEKFAAVFDSYPNSRFISINEFIGHLHASNSGSFTSEKTAGLELNIYYDHHYCRHFEVHPSVWTLELSDWLASRIGDGYKVKVDGRQVNDIYPAAGRFQITIPAGTGSHTIHLGGK